MPVKRQAWPLHASADLSELGVTEGSVTVDDVAEEPAGDMAAEADEAGADSGLYVVEIRVPKQEAQDAVFYAHIKEWERVCNTVPTPPFIELCNVGGQPIDPVSGAACRMPLLALQGYTAQLVLAQPQTPVSAVQHKAEEQPSVSPKPPRIGR